ncbi:MAG: winged helix-turn-helix transcriptional regulator [Spirochaetes bacterium]|nr:winged helix-turn-helix transcriptional regulator [Spirochaetota bacterium]
MKIIQYETESETLKAIAHPLRLKLLDMLVKDECCVTDIARIAGMPQSTISQNLGILKKAGVIQSYKSGVKTCYSIKNDKIIEILAILRK